MVAKEFLDAKQEPKPPLVNRLDRGLTSRWLVEHVYSRLFKGDPDRCTACGLCMGTCPCPTHNIGEEAHGRPVWGRDWLYCEMKCP